MPWRKPWVSLRLWCCDYPEYQARCSDKWSGSFVLRRSLSLGGVTAVLRLRASPRSCGCCSRIKYSAPPLSLIICALYLGNSVIPIEGVMAPRIRLISRPDNLGPEYPSSHPDSVFGGNLPGLGVTAWYLLKLSLTSRSSLCPSSRLGLTLSHH